ncbi:MAG: TolC family protein [candidate division FCPU426 bacterium]
MLHKCILCLGLLGAGWFCPPLQAETLNLDAYVQRVEQNNPALAATGRACAAMAGKIKEAHAVYSPLLNAAYRLDLDRSGLNLESPIQANEIQSHAWNISLSERFATGTLISAGYADTSLTLDLPAPYPIDATTLLSRFTAYDLKPYIRLEQSLLQELVGGMTEAGIRKSELAAESGQYQQLLNRQRILLDARAAYLRLSLCRDIVNFRQEALVRAEDILKWNEKKLQLDLVDPGDLLQARAQHRQSALELLNALDDEKSACRDFNRFCNLDSETVAEEVQSLPELLSRDLNLESLSRTGHRADVLSARAVLAGSEAAVRESRWRLSPELTAFGLASWHGLHTDRAEAFNQVIGAEKPAYAVGAELTLPLDFSLQAATVRGYEQEQEASAAQLRDAEIAAETDWNKLCEQWVHAKAKLEAAREVRDLQARRVELERSKIRRGKTTTWQVVMAENDLDLATMSLHHVMFEALMTLFQSDLYNTQPLPLDSRSANPEVQP